MTMNSLFSLDELSEPEPASREKSKTFATEAYKKAAQRGKRRQKANEVIGKVSPGMILHYVSAGEWSMHDLLFHLLEQTGYVGGDGAPGSH